VPPFAGGGVRGFDDEGVALLRLLLLLRRRLDERFGFSGSGASAASPVSCGAPRRRRVGG